MRKTMMMRAAATGCVALLLVSCSAFNQLGEPKVQNPYGGPNYTPQGGQGQNAHVQQQGGYDAQAQGAYDQQQGGYDPYQQQGAQSQQGAWNSYQQDASGYYAQPAQQQPAYGANQGAWNDYAQDHAQQQPASGGSGGAITHRIRRGDTIYGIAKRYGVRENDVRRWNNIIGDRINAGDTLRIYPGGGGGQNYDAPSGSGAASGDGVRVVGGLRWQRPAQGNVIGSFSKTQGVDIAGYRGQPVYAVADGVAEYADKNSGPVAMEEYGRIVMIQHDATYMTLYGLLSSVSVKKHQRVKRGQEIGRIGGRGKRSYLHFEIRKNGKPRDPFLYLP